MNRRISNRITKDVLLQPPKDTVHEYSSDQNIPGLFTGKISQEILVLKVII